jgi:hypothetical protein
MCSSVFLILNKKRNSGAHFQGQISQFNVRELDINFIKKEYKPLKTVELGSMGSVSKL